ncbi:aldehyde dehydrogenase [Rhodococcus jostii]|uniref:Aldehyde dehydrogenase n=1 Tax=Rhodococcus jostii TaxID=132919 RepID=A0ABU4CG79_RHOJO|nr:aldehyde dehydrogenase [Rhodococcus jostii]MDV6282552.1 aldehyde dehydrogenase [Rhodococcus jostii]
MTEIQYDTLYIDGAWAQPQGDDLIAVRSPLSEQHIGSVPRGTEADIDAAVSAARRAFDDPEGWSTWSPARRGEVLDAFATELEKRGDETARRVTIQNGMPTTVAHGIEAVFPAILVRYYADLMRGGVADEVRPGMTGGSTRVVHDPTGVVAAIVPWNVPQGITFLKLAPALAAGCTVVLKPAEETVFDAFSVAEAAIAAGLPPGVLNIVPAGREVGAYLVAHPGVDKVSFTGSTAAGRSIAETCGRLLRPVTLELGGKSAAIVLDDADLSEHSEAFFSATLLNNGQICWLNTRILVPESNYTAVVDSVTDMVKSLKIGNPLDASTHIGPLVSARQRDRVEGYIAKGRADGFEVTAGGGRPSDLDTGWFVEPTVFVGVDNSATIAQEEIFGPILTVTPYRDEDDAIAIANDSVYGLGGSVWTSDPARGEEIACRIRTGTVGINAYSNDPWAPFGGVKASGLGRELGPEGLRSFQNVKSIYRGA